MELAFQKKFVVYGLQGLNLRIPDIFHVGVKKHSGESWSGSDIMQKYTHKSGSMLLTELYHIFSLVNGDTCMKVHFWDTY